MSLKKIDEIDQKIIELKGYITQCAEILDKTQYVIGSQCKSDTITQNIRKNCVDMMKQIKQDIGKLYLLRLNITDIHIDTNKTKLIN